MSQSVEELAAEASPSGTVRNNAPASSSPDGLRSVAHRVCSAGCPFAHWDNQAELKKGLGRSAASRSHVSACSVSAAAPTDSSK